MHRWRLSNLSYRSLKMTALLHAAMRTTLDSSSINPEVLRMESQNHVANLRRYNPIYSNRTSKRVASNYNRHSFAPYDYVAIKRVSI